MSVNYDNISITEATKIQNELRNKRTANERTFQLNTIGGADISLNLYDTTIYAGIIILSFPELKPLCYSLIKSETHFPYVPGYLAFREVPALVQAWEALSVTPDVLVVDGHGIAHPRRMGIAAHFGVITGQASMGCAKKILTGKFEMPTNEKGAHSLIIDKEEAVGYAYRSKTNVKPVFISPGHNIGLKNSLEIIEQCTGKYRIPEPTRQAHELVNKFRRGELIGGIGSL